LRLSQSAGILIVFQTLAIEQLGECAGQWDVKNSKTQAR
jgi:hypothetical protein